MKLAKEKELAPQKIQQDYLIEESSYIADSEIPVRELEQIVSNLEESLEQARQLVREQEEELADQIKMIVKLEAEQQSASESHRQPLLQKIVENKEIAELLETGLIGQRNNLYEKELAYQQYRELLQKRKEYLKNRDNKLSVDLDNQYSSPKMQQNNHLLSGTQFNTGQFSEDDEGGLDLSQILGIIHRRAFLIAGIACAVTALAALKALKDPPIYQSQFEILIEPTTIETQVISSTNPDTLSSNQEGIVNIRDEAVLKILKSPEILNPIVEKLQPEFPALDHEQLLKRLQRLKITAIGDTLQVVTVSYQDLDKELVKSVMEKVSQTYLEYSRTSRQTGIRRGIKFVGDQLPRLKKRVQSLEMELQKIRQENNLLDPEIKAKELSSSLSVFSQQLLETQIQLKEAKELYTYLQKELAQQSPGSVVASPLNESSRYQSLLNQLQEIDIQIAKDSVLLFEDSPEIKILQNQRQSLLPLIRQEGQRVAREKASEIRTLERRTQFLSETITSLNQQLRQISAILSNYTEIERERQIANESFNKFLSEREALRIDISQTENPWRLLVAPEEPKPSSASLKQNLVLGMILGLLLGIGMALVLDKFSNRLYTSKEVKEVTKLPILGVIPFEKELVKFTTTERASDLIDQVDLPLELNNGHKSDGYNRSGFIEAFRSLYTKLRFVEWNSPIHSLVVSSAGTGDGKSTVAIYLAQASAALGQRVLLVDADLRHPSLHQHLKLTNDQGLTNILSPEALDFNLAIQRSTLEDKLFVLTTGSSSVDPTRLLASQKMEDLMKELQTTFDLVIYKAPPLLGLADSYLLTTHTDGVLLVVSLGKLKRSILEQALDELKLSRTKILGIVTNCIS